MFPQDLYLCVFLAPLLHVDTLDESFKIKSIERVLKYLFTYLYYKKNFVPLTCMSTNKNEIAVNHKQNKTICTV